MPPVDAPDPHPTHPDAGRTTAPTSSEAGSPAGRSLSSLGVRQRRRAIAGAMARVLAAWIVLIGAFYLYPGRVGTAGGAAIKLVIGIVLLVVIVGFEVRQIAAAPLPEVRAIEALGVTLVVFLVIFAGIYLSLGEGAHSMFNVTLDHSRALYFVVTVFATVGFGDIVPTTDPVRLVVAAQMLLDLVFIGVVVRILVLAARRAVEQKS